MTHLHVGADWHAYHVASALVAELSAAGQDVTWHGPPRYDEGDDYPAIAVRAMQAVVADEDAGRDARALILGGAGAGEVIAANKVNGARVVSATEVAYVRDARRHADINGLVVPVQHVDEGVLRELLETLVNTPFSNDLDDARRLVNIAEFETSGTIEGWTVDP